MDRWVELVEGLQMTKKLSERLSEELVYANKQGDTHLAGLLRDAAALARRVEGAAVGRVPRSKIGDMLLFPVSHDLAGKRVRLVPEGD